jgi:hypothetical protein
VVDPTTVAESGGPPLNSVHTAPGAVWLSGEVHRIGVEHLLGELDKDKVSDGHEDQRAEELPRQRGEPERVG